MMINFEKTEHFGNVSNGEYLLNSKQIARLKQKVDELKEIYQPYLFKNISELEVTYLETEQFYSSPPSGEYKKIVKGDEWGGEYKCGWFKTCFTVSEESAGKNLHLFSLSGAVEHLIYINGIPKTALDYVADGERPFFRLHKYARVADLAKVGERYEIFLEGYSSHTIEFLNPLDTSITFATTGLNPLRKFGGIFLGEIDEDVRALLINLHFLQSVTLSLQGYEKAQMENAYEQVFNILSRVPSEIDFLTVKESIATCNAFFKSVFKERDVVANNGCGLSDNSAKNGSREGGNQIEDLRATLVGHSHMDTVWLWDTDETKRKLARTCCIAIEMLEKFDRYTFTQSSTLHLEWIKDNYPTIFEGLKRYEKEGRYEPCGGSFVECDCNLTGGEAFIRHFILGQRFMKDNFGHYADCYWLPDTFGYSAAIPQILNGCKISGFMTTKINANDTNRFSYDTFYWRGLDGSQVLTQYNIIHCYPDPFTIADRLNFVEDKRTLAPTLISYGFGDGGGGPDETMARLAEMSEKSEYAQKSQQGTVSSHMQKVRQCARIPVYSGELYFELHRGTFTSMSRIKRYNRKLELRLKATETALTLLGLEDARLIEAYRLVLINQFHDILPGTSINSVNKNVYLRYEQAEKLLDGINRELLNKSGQQDKYFNPHSFDIDTVCEVDYAVESESVSAVDCKSDFAVNCKSDFAVNCKSDYQVNCKSDCELENISYIGLSGGRKILRRFKGKAFSSLSAQEVKKGKISFDGRFVLTPYYSAEIDENGGIISLIDLINDRELVKEGGKINYFTLFEDMPLNSDNWDIDADYFLKRKSAGKLINSEVILTNHLRIRHIIQLTNNSTLTQDIIFYNNSARIDFASRLNWADKHKLLKANFDLDIKASFYKSEIQFGHLDRVITKNNSIEQARFEVCNHKFTNLSEPSYGVSLLNDCKYGIACDENSLSLTLIKSGTHPDFNGDEGEHYFSYALLPHTGYFSADKVVKPAYEFNLAPILCDKEVSPPFRVVNGNVLVETVKMAEEIFSEVINEEKIAKVRVKEECEMVLRLYECEGTKSNLQIAFNKEVVVSETDMLENVINSTKTKLFSRTMRAFEILTLKITR